MGSSVRDVLVSGNVEYLQIAILSNHGWEKTGVGCRLLKMAACPEAKHELPT